MRLATTTGDYIDYTDSQELALRHIRAAGFHYADYNFCIDYRSRAGVYSPEYPSYMDRIKSVTDECGITLVQAHAPMGDPLSDPDGSFFADTARCVEACGEWGIPNLVVHSGYLPGLSREETLSRNRDFFVPLLAISEQYGVNILVENFNRMCIPETYWIDDAPDLLAMIELVDHPLFHAVWDVGHANMQQRPQDEAIRMLGGHLRALHVQDNMGDRDAHLAPFLGTLNLDAVMHGLSEINYNGYFTFEVGRFFLPRDCRRTYGGDTRLASAPLALRDAFEEYLYKMGKCILESYGCYED